MASQNGEPEPDERVEAPDFLPETIITPIGIRVLKILQADGSTVTMAKLLTPGHVYSIKMLKEEDAQAFADALLGGIRKATLLDLPPGVKT